MKQVAILGSTGSIGTQALDVIARYPRRFSVTALTAGKNVSLMAEQVRRFEPHLAAMGDPEAAEALKKLIPRGVRVLAGEEGMLTAAAQSDADILLTSVVGSVGLGPTLAAIDAGVDIALANKETLVAAGSIVTAAAKRRGVRLLPVDSEHNAIFQALKGHRHEHISRLILTASGGPFWQRTRDDLHDVTPEEAVRHPRWNMGAKISVDSATMMNKALEIIEARWLFDVPGEKIDVLIHPQSIVHSLVEYRDGSQIAQLGTADMRIPIAYALSYPERIETQVKRLKLSDVEGGLAFFPPDEARFPALGLARRALAVGGTMPAVLSAANERAVELFLDRKLPFSAIESIVAAVMERHIVVDTPDLEDVFEADRWARGAAENAGEEL
ncbi:MAG: 1-deoxy-D-xylulose-5-phosphate reductoisomerase [Deltaproteobacteria bacterium]|nr:1-deoxy-D-xylulose-5-phosphate reductoisomerase [Candidatus Zymogenaceae bacterium]